MWNVFKIGKSIHHLFTVYGQDNVDGLKEYQSDLIGDDRLDHVLVLYRELNFPFGLMHALKMRQRAKSRDIMWGRSFNERNYVEQTVIPALMDFDHLKTLAPNTVGAHYHHLVKKWGIEDLYNQRFKPEEKRDGFYTSFSDDMRESVSRHNLLSHDLWHCLYRYDTSPLGEACIQTISAYLSKYWPMHIVGFVVCLKLAFKHSSLTPLKVWREACRLGKQTSEELFEQSPLYFLDKDIEEVRKQFNVKPAVVFAKWVKENPNSFRMDTIHPQYKDELFSNESVVL